ncbi:hypothetical protein RHGRI_018149 [Rhododendron griersonianum]|uniref:UBP-type domain-containing protein n=1 Tax=Rhododendron griersonianum TaxID=479676 RepID=A0AAV6K0L0_9ERIC|nr:hypothetical protein RHGRI_018149 [Rhododendron griersonianum]
MNFEEDSNFGNRESYALYLNANLPLSFPPTPKSHQKPKRNKKKKYKRRIHTVDDSSNPFPTTSSAAPGPKPSTTNKNDDFSHITELKGVVHLFRCLSPATASLTSPSSRSTTLFVAAVPNYLSREEFLTFCGPHLDHFSQLCFLRNDGMEDRYSVLITLVNQLRSDGFYCSFNGNLFRPSEAEVCGVCHIYCTQSVVYYKLKEEAGLPPHGFVCRLCQQHDEEPECADCGTFKNLWVCVICGSVGCGRYQEKHAVRHWEDAQHCISLELESQRVWDYVGCIYVHRLNQSKADGKSANMNSMSIHGECSTCGCSEDSGISEALYDSKVEAMVDEYDRLSANEMETQRKRFESQLKEAKSKKERSVAEAVEKALASRMQDIQSKLEHYDDVAVTHQRLMRRQEILEKVVKEKEERAKGQGLVDEGTRAPAGQ